MKKAIVLVSGGIDSTALLCKLQRAFVECLAISFDYGQRNRMELKAAHDICAYLKVDLKFVDLNSFGDLFQGNALTTAAITSPPGHYADGLMKMNVVPNRNMIFLSLATAYAIQHGADKIAFAIHDHVSKAEIYPDTTPQFVEKLSDAISLASENKIEIFAPFKYWTKADIVKDAAHFKAPLNLTWSCYRDGDKPCGVCGTCVERREAFERAGVKDEAP